MIDSVSETMRSKIELPSRRPYKNLARIQTAIAEAEMILGSALTSSFP